MSDLWACRQCSEVALNKDLSPIGDALHESFARVHEVVESFQKFLYDESAAARICTLVAIKSSNLAQGCYSLALDGLAQESGALLRPLVECLELLIYIRTVPGSVDEVLEKRLPQAGKIAAKIDGKLKRLREYLNENASHLGLTDYSMMHLVDVERRVRIIQPFVPGVLEYNLALLFLFVSALASQSALCFEWCAAGKVSVVSESLLNKVTRSLSRGESIALPILQRRRPGQDDPASATQSESA
jgi:hypothetical protein